MDRIYLDNNASTPIDPAVFETFVKVSQRCYGNPSSSHSEGRQARATVTHARAVVAEYLGVHPDEILFTSGATEGNNLLLKGIFGYERSGHLVTSNVEHSSTYRIARHLEERGFSVTYLPAGEEGTVRAEAVAEALRPDTRAIALIAANNETGVISDLNAIAAVAEKQQVPLIVDGVAWLGKAEIGIPRGVSALCFSGHKIHAPKGVGVLYRKKELKLQPQVLGGSHEYGLRAGTENVAVIAAMAHAIELLPPLLPQAIARMEQLRTLFEQELMRLLPDVAINGSGRRICNCSNIAFLGADGELLLALLDQAGVSCSHGSACASGALEPSRVLLNMGYSRARVRASLRFSLSRLTSEEEVRDAIVRIVATVAAARPPKSATSR